MKIYLVGGAVRDKLMNFPYVEKDWVVVGGSPEALLKQGYQPVGKDFPVFLHPDSKEEYALARIERKAGIGYTGFECFSSPDVTLEEDLQRRDLTINAMAEDEQGNIIDPYGGQHDLANKLLRHVSPAFSEDPLRVLRVARFIARYHYLGFSIAAETLQLMQAITNNGELNSLPKERVWKELQRALAERNPEQFFFSLQQCGAIRQLLPELEDSFSASMAAFTRVSQSSDDPVIRFAGLFPELDKQASEQLCNSLKPPKEYRDLALLINRYGKLTDASTLTAEQKMTILEKTDAFRRPERFAKFLTTCDILYQHTTAQQLHAALAASKTVDIKSLAERYTGKTIANEIRKHRIAAIAESQLCNNMSNSGKHD